MPGTPTSSGRASNRDLILSAALAEITERGYAGVTTRSIARRAAVDPRLVRYYFATNDALLAEALGEFDLAGALDGTRGTPPERMSAIWDSHPLEWRAMVAGGVSAEPALRRSFADAAGAFARLRGGRGENADLQALLIFGQLLGIWLLTRAADGDQGFRAALVRNVGD